MLCFFGMKPKSRRALSIWWGNGQTEPFTKNVLSSVRNPRSSWMFFNLTGSYISEYYDIV